MPTLIYELHCHHRRTYRTAFLLAGPSTLTPSIHLPLPIEFIHSSSIFIPLLSLIATLCFPLSLHNRTVIPWLALLASYFRSLTSLVGNQ